MRRHWAHVVLAPVRAGQRHGSARAPAQGTCTGMDIQGGTRQSRGRSRAKSYPKTWGPQAQLSTSRANGSQVDMQQANAVAWSVLRARGNWLSSRPADEISRAAGWKTATHTHTYTHTHTPTPQGRSDGMKARGRTRAVRMQDETYPSSPSGDAAPPSESLFWVALRQHAQASCQATLLSLCRAGLFGRAADAPAAIVRPATVCRGEPRMGAGRRVRAQQVHAAYRTHQLMGHPSKPGQICRPPCQTASLVIIAAGAECVGGSEVTLSQILLLREMVFRLVLQSAFR